ncbi:MAG: hypothetical protein FVQ82_08850 [Planctomycetes bacterium]|nr:hypothetical protein [Planctomycetota bacterium]
MTDKSDTTENPKPLAIRRPKNLRMVLLSLVILTAGIVIGSATTTLFIQKNSRKPGDYRPGGRMILRLKKRLDLSDDQSEKIEPIIKTFMDKHRIIKEKARPQVEALVSEMKEGISALLTEDQKEKWQEWQKHIERGFRMRRGPGPHRPKGSGYGGGPHRPRDGRGPGGGRGPRDGRGPGSPRGSRPEGQGRRHPTPSGPNMPPPPTPGNPQ